mgnify:CR=1 FL=1
MSRAEEVLRCKRMACSDAEWIARCELACAYRIFHGLGWHELIYNHISLRVEGGDGCFLINPFGLLYDEVRASNLVKIDIDGRIVEPTPYEINPAGFVVHSAVHRARPDAHCVMHTHTTTGMAVACLEEGLQPLSFPAMFFTGRLGYHDFEGITFDNEERARLARALGGAGALILRNHGLLSCGASVADAFAELYHLQRACDVQIAALSAGRWLRVPPMDVARRVAEQFSASARRGTQNRLLFDALFRAMLRDAPDFLE